MSILIAVLIRHCSINPRSTAQSWLKSPLDAMNYKFAWNICRDALLYLILRIVPYIGRPQIFGRISYVELIR